MIYAVILAGGKGERFWPLSTPEFPKPFLRFFSERSLLQQTFDRVLSFTDPDHILLVVGEQHAAIAHQQLPKMKDSQLLMEPAGRDTAAAIGYASLQLPPDALMLVCPADHMIPETEQFAHTVRKAAIFLEDHGGPCTFGIPPDRPETGYGYIHASAENLWDERFPVYAVDQFIEKPDLARAQEFVLQKSYYWNSGIFFWKVSRIQELLSLHLPGLWKGLHQLREEKDPVRWKRKYSELERISIDFGVMQKADRVCMVPANFRWDDIGMWTSLVRILPVNQEGNLVWGSHQGMDTQNCILYAENHTMVTAGIHDLIVVQRGENILICDKSYADRLKLLLAKLST